MPISLQPKNDDELEIVIKGRFDFKDHSTFRDCYRSQNPSAKYTINMKEAEYLDSSALGMMLLLREHAGGDKAEISVINVSPEIMRIFKISSAAPTASARAW